MMQNSVLLAMAMALVNTAGVLASPNNSALENFISVAGAAASQASTAAAAQPTPTTTSSSSSSAVPSSTSAAPSATSATAAAASSGGLSDKARTDIIIVCTVLGVLLLAAIAGCLFCCLRRRRRTRRVASPFHDDETSGWPTDSHRASNLSNTSNSHHHEMSQEPTIPLMIPATSHHNDTARPLDNEHPAFRHENPFVPVPPVPRKTAPNSHAGLTHGAAAGAAAYVGAHEGDKRLHKSDSMPRSHSGSALHDSYAHPNQYNGEYGNTGPGYNREGYQAYNPSRNDSTNPFSNKSAVANPTLPIGVNGLASNPHHSNTAAPAYTSTASGPIHDGPYRPTQYGPRESTIAPIPSHQHHHHPTPLSSSSPNSPQHPTPYTTIGTPYTDMHVHQLQTDTPSPALRSSLQQRPSPTARSSRSPHKRYSTPPLVPSRSPNRRSGAPPLDSTYESGTTTGSGSGSYSTEASSDDSWKALGGPPRAPWEQGERERRWSGARGGGGGSPVSMRERSRSGGARTPERGGTPKRLRFSDLEAEEMRREQGRFGGGVGRAM